MYDYDDLVEYLDHLHEQALDLEDYEFCKALVNKRLYSKWKNDEINNGLNED